MSQSHAIFSIFVSRGLSIFGQEILLKANEAEMKQNLNYVGRCEVLLVFSLEKQPAE
jgi:hypothetical protein